MLQTENVNPEKLGYDRPSEKLLGFLAKHYGLKRYVPQNNNYVVFSAYFETGPQKPNPTNEMYTTSYGGGLGGNFGENNSKKP